MSDVLEVVTIKTENGPVDINKKDYDAEVHTLWEAETVVEKFDRNATKDYLTSMGVQFAKNISNDDLAKLLEETKQKLAGA